MRGNNELKIKKEKERKKKKKKRDYLEGKIMSKYAEGKK